MPRTSHIATVLFALYAIIYVLAATFHGWDLHHALASAALAPLLIALTAIDISTFRLPDPLTLLVFVLGVVVAALTDLANMQWKLVAAALGSVGLLAISLAYQRVRGHAGLGLGDVKLYGAAGMWVGLDGLASILLLACLAALVDVAAAVVKGRQITSTTPLPFGPFLCFGFWTTWSFGPLV